ncbi:MAG: non-canonical purine NTP pyrophosphatase, RdgB/HAM1 family [Sulfurimonas sp.]|nr:MAG: non-canonical purine NTP pyrophosphatase, RdgB/HAM1 family [Sulfurimonas sp.]
MKLVLATSNKGKVKEIKAMYSDFDVVAYSELMTPFDIVEDGIDFKANALIKARAVYDALDDAGAIVLADDSGISVDVLGGAPGIYSARYAGEGADDTDNLHRLMDAIKAKGVTHSRAHYTAAIALVSAHAEETVHGWMYGTAITEARGRGGFGYDPMFIPLGFDNTLGELSREIKVTLSHRSQALERAKILLER